MLKNRLEESKSRGRKDIKEATVTAQERDGW